MKRTLRQALEQIVINLSTPGLLSAPGQCRYRDQENGKPCIIGSLLPEPLIERILVEGFNMDLIGSVMTRFSLADFVGPLGGMDGDQASAIQDVYDGDSSGARSGDPVELCKQVQSVLNQGFGEIGVARIAEFDLR